MRETIFQSTETMPPMNNSPDVARVAQTRVEMRDARLPLVIPDRDMSVQTVERPRRGHGY